MISKELTRFSLDKNLNTTLIRAIDLAIEEDLGIEENEDITTISTVSENTHARAIIQYKELGVVAGLEVCELVFKRFSNTLTFNRKVEEGFLVKELPTSVLEIEGPARAILTGERLVLNLMQRMSAVATLTRAFVDKTKGTDIKILDTRKTAPGLRAFDRIAVSIGGGVNHRSGLYDQILIKDNHIAVAGSITKAIEQARSKYPKKSLEIETRTIDEVKEAAKLNPDIILLDNMSPGMIKESISIIGGKSKTEISGGINLETIENYILPGVDAISVGALTHSCGSIDISLETSNFNIASI